jgi:hypothetical protein
MNKELITIIDDNNVMYVGEAHNCNDETYLLRNVVTVGYSVDAAQTVSVSLLPVGIPDILLDRNDNFVNFQTKKIKIESSSKFTPEFIEKYNSTFSSDAK